MMYWRRYETRDWEHKLMFTMFTQGLNQERSRVIFYRLLYNQRSHPSWTLERMQLQDTSASASPFRPGGFCLSDTAQYSNTKQFNVDCIFREICSLNYIIMMTPWSVMIHIWLHYPSFVYLPAFLWTCQCAVCWLRGIQLRNETGSWILSNVTFICCH